ncbi:MAG: hypothetical protein Q8R04_01575 [Nanoarchaeota archaeon]|nr:hypothetical protein [Nanoarchaeota archaeon]
MRNLIKRLEKRGWRKREIINAVEIIRNAKKNKPSDIKFLENRIYWILLVMIVVANFAISVAIMPLLIALRGMILYFVLVVLGIVLGLLFEVVIRSIEHLEKKHHVFLAILIPLIALANVFVISNISNDLTKTLNLTNVHNSIIIAIVYAASFVLPYIIYHFVLKIEYYAKE